MCCVEGHVGLGGGGGAFRNRMTLPNRAEQFGGMGYFFVKYVYFLLHVLHVLLVNSI